MRDLQWAASHGLVLGRPRFDVKSHVNSDWQVVQAYSKSDFVNLSSVVPLWSLHLLPLTQNTLPFKDVREYVF